MGVDEEAERAWTAFVGPYRVEAERLGFRFIERHRTPSERHLFTDVALDQRGAFLEVTGEIGDGDNTGLVIFWWVNLNTYISGKYLLCRTTHGGAPRPASRSIAGWLFEAFRAAIDRAFTPELLKRVTVNGPGDLEGMLTRHRQCVQSAQGDPLVPTDDPLGSRRLWEERLGDEYDDDGVPKERVN